MHYARNTRLFVLYDFHNKQLLVPYAILTEVNLSVRYKLNLFILCVDKCLH
jgi:hypothetical protein